MRIAKKAAFEVVELFQPMQSGVTVRGGTESIVQAIKINSEKKKRSQSGSTLQIHFGNVFNSMKRSHFLGSTKVLMPSVMPFASV